MKISFSKKEIKVPGDLGGKKYELYPRKFMKEGN